MKKLELAPHLMLPPDAATQVYAFMGKRGSGKTYAAGKLTELLLGAGVQTIVMDPVGNWWGLRLAADGKHAGFEIPVLGGEHGDIPLAVDAGELVADMLVDTGSSAILDVSPFSKSARKTFIGAFAEHFFQRKKTNRSAVHVVLEEAHLVLPQKPNHGEERMLGALEDLVRLGRNYGIGVSMLDQRPQSVSKEALNQAEVLLAFQLIGAHERDAIKKWVDYHGSSSDLATLNVQKPGEAVVWAPWLDKPGVYRVHAKKTFDSSATPKAGASTRERKLKRLDLKALETRMSEVVEQVKANDPKALKASIAERNKRIAELEKQLAGKASTPQLDAKTIARQERQLREEMKSKAAQLALIDKQLARGDQLIMRIDGTVQDLTTLRTELAKDLDGLRTIAAATKQPPAKQSTPPQPPEATKRTAPRALQLDHGEHDESAPTGAVRKILVALAQHPEGLPDRKIGVFAGVSTKGGTWTSHLGRARRAGWLEDGRGIRKITDAGLAALGHFDPLPTGSELAQYWIRELGGAPARVLQVLIDAYPADLDDETIGERAGVSIKGGTWSEHLKQLRTRDLIEDVGGRRRVASATLFEDGKYS